MSVTVKNLGRALSNATIRLHESIARAAGLSNTDHKYLYVIADHGKLTAGDIADKTGLTTGAVTGLIDRLEARALVRRVFDKADRRKVFVEADPEEIAKLLSPLSAKVEKRVTSVVNKYSAGEQELIGRYLTDITAVLEQLAVEIDQQTNNTSSLT